MSDSKKNPIRVKFIAPGLHDTSDTMCWLRQFPNRQPVWGNCYFTFDPNDSEYDWLVAYNGLPFNRKKDWKKSIERLKCPKEHTLFITLEPSSISTYGTDFLNQFGYVLTGQEDWAIKHPGKIHSQPALHWFYGYNQDNDTMREMLDYDFMKANPPVDKNKVISTVTSAKQQKHTQHQARFNFAEAACKAIPELERFGKGIKEIVDKSEALDRYKYHIAIENHICDHWWTEKLSDSFLGHTLPFYHGAPNAADYFPADSFIPININHIDESIDIIKSAISNHEYEKRIESIKEARRRTLDEYNIFSTLSRIINEKNNPNATALPKAQILGKHALRKDPVKAVRIGFQKTAMRIRTVLTK